MFFLCWFAWVAVHAQREFWAMSKKTILEETSDPHEIFEVRECRNVGLSDIEVS